MIFDKKQFPANAGVYFFRNKNGQILYIGKAANLRNRLKSYFDSRSKDPRILKMLELAEKADWQETDSEIEALILESQLIKKHKPAFNVMLRDDKQYFYVEFSEDNFTKIFLTHQPGKSAKNRIGPFTDGAAIKTALGVLRRTFPFCTCKQKHNNYCLNYHIGKCPGFCCLKKPMHETSDAKDATKIYGKNIRAIRDVISGRRASLIKSLKKEMDILAKNEEFEKAAELRDKIEKLKKVFANAGIIRHSALDIRYPNSEKLRYGILKDLAESLKLNRSPMRIEGYDVANMQGEYAVGAMVVFINGQPSKNRYRKFKIRGGTGPNDIAMLREILIRRCSHPEWTFPDLIIVDGGKAHLNIARSVISGIATKQKSRITHLPHRRRSKTSDIPIVALTKNDKHRGSHIFTENKKTAILLADLPIAVRNLILQIDSEAHRFAISYYRKLHKSTLGK
ncbi:MAG: GIY-YIG nuclease family protein [Candidatus Yanofskybacteria bacterium]|nr:GIY-YIG nuclease family protein [Candidatus Yanofskybacteria bacterium]